MKVSRSNEDSSAIIGSGSYQKVGAEGILYTGGGVYQVDYYYEKNLGLADKLLDIFIFLYRCVNPFTVFRFPKNLKRLFRSKKTIFVYTQKASLGGFSQKVKCFFSGSRFVPGKKDLKSTASKVVEVVVRPEMSVKDYVSRFSALLEQLKQQLPLDANDQTALQKDHNVLGEISALKREIKAKKLENNEEIKQLLTAYKVFKLACFEKIEKELEETSVDAFRRLQYGIQSPMAITLGITEIDFRSALMEIKGLKKDGPPDKSNWKKVRGCIWKGIKDGRLTKVPSLGDFKPVIWLTGTKVSTVLGMFQVAKKAAALGETNIAPALVPTGVLLSKYNIVPFSGEMGVGVSANGINQFALSGTDLENICTVLKYADSNYMFFSKDRELEMIPELIKSVKCNNEVDREYFDSNVNDMYISRIKIAILRLAHSGNLNDSDKSKIRAQLESLRRINIDAQLRELRRQTMEKFGVRKDLLDSKSEIKDDWKLYFNLVGVETVDALYKYPKGSLPQVGELVAVRSPNALVRFALVKKLKIHESGKIDIDCMVEHQWGARSCCLERIYVVDDDTKKRFFNSRDLGISAKKAFFMSFQDKVQELIDLLETPPEALVLEKQYLLQDNYPVVFATTNTTLCRRSVFGGDGEISVEQNLSLGSDIQFAFTDRANVGRLRKELEGFSVNVLDRDVLRILRTS